MNINRIVLELEREAQVHERDGFPVLAKSCRGEIALIRKGDEIMLQRIERDRIASAEITARRRRG